MDDKKIKDYRLYKEFIPTLSPEQFEMFYRIIVSVHGYSPDDVLDEFYKYIDTIYVKSLENNNQKMIKLFNYSDIVCYKGEYFYRYISYDIDESIYHPSDMNNIIKNMMCCVKYNINIEIAMNDIIRYLYRIIIKDEYNDKGECETNIIKYFILFGIIPTNIKRPNNITELVNRIFI